jgi:hypothetical protein
MTTHHSAPSCHDNVTTTCPVCNRSFAPTGRQRYCSGACRAAAYRARRDNPSPHVEVRRAQPRRPITIYECDSCGHRALGQQYCDNCNTWMSKLGIGGLCPSCDEPIAITELGHQVTE